jgi:hypothetical protein
MNEPKDQDINPEHFVNENIFPGAAITRGPNLMEVIEEYEKTGKVKSVPLADLLAAIDVLYRAFGDDIPDAFRSDDCTPIPKELIAILIAQLTGRVKRIQDFNDDQSREAQRQRSRARELKESDGPCTGNASAAARQVIMEDFPGLIDLDKEEFDRRADTLRQGIREK